mgnify:CR=1 FL=1
MAINRNYAASTQNVAMNAIVFLYKRVLQLPISDEIAAIRSKKPVRLPVVLSCDEVSQILGHLSGVSGLMTQLLYGGGLRLMEVCRLRVQDFDFSNGLFVKPGLFLNQKITG